MSNVISLLEYRLRKRDSLQKVVTMPQHKSAIEDQQFAMKKNKQRDAKPMPFTGIPYRTVYELYMFLNSTYCPVFYLDCILEQYAQTSDIKKAHKFAKQEYDL